MLWGLYFYGESAPSSLPLQSVHADCTIRDTTALVSLRQKYQNTFEPLSESQRYVRMINRPPDGIVHGRYSFPVPDRAAVCAFAMIKQDGSRIVGVVEEKEDARDAYNQAKREGKLASLMEMSSGDVFTVLVGNILPKETVTVEITYAVELTDDEENDSLRFHLPMLIAARYGTSPTDHFIGTPKQVFLSLSVSIEMAYPLSKIGSPSHPIMASIGPNATLGSQLPTSLHANFAVVSLTSKTPLSKDFILMLKSARVDDPRCIAECHPVNDTLALAVTLVPKFSLPDIPAQEYIFVVDLSGSMGDYGRLATAKKALVVLLRSLPTENTIFNIESFGSSASMLWKTGSRPYHQDTLDTATRHVDQMLANYGGTEINMALTLAFTLRQKKIPTSIFVLTDGDSWDTATALKTTANEVLTAPPHSPLRVFTLGIGDSASTAMVDGIAREGNGVSTFVSDGESFTGKTARLLKAARTPALTDFKMDWGVSPPGEKSKIDDDDFLILEDSDDKHDTDTLVDEPTKKPMSMFDSNIDPLKASSSSTGAAPVPILPIQQAPILRNIFPGSRLRIYAILSSPAWTRGQAIPSTVTLRATLASGEELHLDIPVVPSKIHERDTPVHTLAAKKLIQIYDNDESMQSTVVRLGKTYSLASKYTSFVAVDEGKDAARPRRHPIIYQALPVVSQPMYYASSYGSAQPPPVVISHPVSRAQLYTEYAGDQAYDNRYGFNIQHSQVQPQSYPAPYDPTCCDSYDSYDPTIEDDTIYYGGQEEYSTRRTREEYSVPNSSSQIRPTSLSANVQPAAEVRPQHRRMSSGWSTSTIGSGGKLFSKMFSSSSSKSSSTPPATPPATPKSKKRFSFTGLKGSVSVSSQSAPSTDLLDIFDALDTKPTKPKKKKNTTTNDIIATTTDAPLSLDLLARLQSFDGSFTLPAWTLCTASNKNVTLQIILNALPLEIQTTTVGVTLFAMASMKKRLTFEREEWGGLYEKAEKWVANEIKSKGCVTNVEQLVESVWSVAEGVK